MGELKITGRWDTKPAMRTHQVDAAREHLGQVFARHTLVPADPKSSLDFVHRQAGRGQISLHSLTYGAGVEVKLEIPDFYFLQVTLQGMCQISSRYWDVILKPGSIFVMNPNVPYTKSWSPDARQLQLKIPVPLLRRHLQHETEDISLREIDFSTAILSDQGSGGALLNLINYLCQDYSDDDGLWQTPSAVEQMESALLSAILHIFPHSQSLRIQNKLSPAAPFYVRRAEDFIRAHLVEAIGVADVCAAVGVSARTLQDGFRRFRDATPAEYIRNLRLELARQQIAAAKTTGMNVTQIALACGFNHVGRFAGFYYERFGEMPFQSLRGVKGHQTRW